jgi:hypothetical protein
LAVSNQPTTISCSTQDCTITTCATTCESVYGVACDDSTRCDNGPAGGSCGNYEAPSNPGDLCLGSPSASCSSILPSSIDCNGGPIAYLTSVTCFCTGQVTL